MKKTIALVVFSLLPSTAACLSKECESHDFGHPAYGRYCPTEGITIPNFPWHQCKLFCLETLDCQSVNYNYTDNICSYFTATCPKAISHPVMAFTLFTGRTSEECLEWIPKGVSHPSQDDRAVTEDNTRFTARMQKDGTDCLGHMMGSFCYAKDEGGQFNSHQGYPCQYLRVSNRCTVYYVEYELGTPLSPNALIAGNSVLGLPVYFVIKEGTKAPRSYIPKSNSFVFLMTSLQERKWKFWYHFVGHC